ncbi:MAG: hybrid sensor histidine kinase/response regulator transcription factor [Ktedonobacteraceae bacterium]|nr:hybrid sensor histidine kinase/response regulator transcription factor [Ktedonobacteraceae bacterium]
MVPSDQLLQLITHLQSNGDRIYTRNMLLKYIRKHSKAQLVVLFALDREQQALLPLAYTGKLPDRQPSSPSTGPHPSIKQRATQPVPLNGLFASALSAQGLLYIPLVEQDIQISPQELNWSYPQGSMLLNAITGADQLKDERGILALCFSAEHKNRQFPERIPPTVNEGEVLICSHLLSTSLSTEKPPEQQSAPSRVPRSRRASRRKELEQETVELLQKPQVEQQGTFPELMYSLSTLADLYEIGLVPDENIDAQELYQHILSSLARVIHAPCACLLLYHPSLRRLLPGARIGDELSCTSLIDSIDGVEMERLSMRGPGEVLSFLTSGEHNILLVTLSCNCVLLGVVALTLNSENSLSDERGLLLTYMGNVAALLLRNYSVHARELQAAVEHERTRIARDIHDGAAQRIGHVLHKLEFIQRVLDKQALWPHLLQAALIEVERAYTILEAGLADLRHGISSLLPVQLEEQDFVGALQNLLDEHMINDPGLEIIYNVDVPDALPATLEAPIFRFIQEALTNVRKHAQATQVAIRLKMASNALVVEVSDNGIGFQSEAVPAQRIASAESSEGALHFGMRTMRERIQEVGGSIEVQSRANEGTIVRVRFPLANSMQLLTSREHEVLRLIVDGQTNRDIAQKLSISRETVKSHVHHIMQKMQVKDRTQAAVLATRQGWL